MNVRAVIHHNFLNTYEIQNVWQKQRVGELHVCEQSARFTVDGHPVGFIVRNRTDKVVKSTEQGRQLQEEPVNQLNHTPHGTNALTRKPKRTVKTPPPMNPSQVFLGDNLMRGVFPKKNPKMYAIISLQMIMETGTTNQMRPSKMFLIIK